MLREFDSREELIQALRQLDDYDLKSRLAFAEFAGLAFMNQQSVDAVRQVAAERGLISKEGGDEQDA